MEGTHTTQQQKQKNPNESDFKWAKETINKTKRQSMDWEKIFANDATNRGLISKIYEQLI